MAYESRCQETGLSFTDSARKTPPAVSDECRSTRSRTCVGRCTSSLSMGRYHLPILVRLRQAAGIRNKSLSTLQCKFLEMCMETMCNQVAKLFLLLWLLIWFGCVVCWFHNGEKAQSVWGSSAG